MFDVEQTVETAQMVDGVQRGGRDLSEQEWDALLRDLITAQRAAEEAAPADAQLAAVLDELRALRQDMATLQREVATLTGLVRAR